MLATAVPQRHFFKSDVAERNDPHRERRTSEPRRDDIRDVRTGRSLGWVSLHSIGRLLELRVCRLEDFSWHLLAVRGRQDRGASYARRHDARCQGGSRAVPRPSRHRFAANTPLACSACWKRPHRSRNACTTGGVVFMRELYVIVRAISSNWAACRPSCTATNASHWYPFRSWPVG